MKSWTEQQIVIRANLMREILNYLQVDIKKIDSVKNLINSITDNLDGNISHELNELSCITGKNILEWSSLNIGAGQIRHFIKKILLKKDT